MYFEDEAPKTSDVARGFALPNDALSLDVDAGTSWGAMKSQTSARPSTDMSAYSKAMVW